MNKLATILLSASLCISVLGCGCATQKFPLAAGDKIIFTNTPDQTAADRANEFRQFSGVERDTNRRGSIVEVDRPIILNFD